MKLTDMRLTASEYQQSQRARNRKVSAGFRKYRNVPVNGFDSKAESRRYDQLLLLKAAGEVADIQRQVPYELVPTQRSVDGRTLERKITYFADFVITYADGQIVVEDVKSPITRKSHDYVIKRKLMLWRHGIVIQEVS